MDWFGHSNIRKNNDFAGVTDYKSTQDWSDP
jgi:hypothetical protein